MGYFKHFCVGISGAFFALLASAFLMSAQAAVVTWYLNDVTFDDGGTAEGSFVYDADSNTYSDISITTKYADGTELETYDVAWGTSSTQNALITINENSSIDFTDAPVLVVLWSAALTDLGGLVAINTTSILSRESKCISSDCTGSMTTLRYFETGYLTSYVVSDVPLPAALPLFIAGLAGIGAIGRRQKAAA